MSLRWAHGCPIKSWRKWLEKVWNLCKQQKMGGWSRGKKYVNLILVVSCAFEFSGLWRLNLHPLNVFSFGSNELFPTDCLCNYLQSKINQLSLAWTLMCWRNRGGNPIHQHRRRPHTSFCHFWLNPQRRFHWLQCWIRSRGQKLETGLYWSSTLFVHKFFFFKYCLQLIIWVSKRKLATEPRNPNLLNLWERWRQEKKGQHFFPSRQWRSQGLQTNKTVAEYMAWYQKCLFFSSFFCITFIFPLVSFLG